MQSTWNAFKAEANFRKHRVRFEEADTIFLDPLIVVMDDLWHSDEEARLIAIGLSTWGNVIVLSYVVEDGDARIISARCATTTERRRYMRGDSIRDRGPEQPIDLSDIPEVDFTNGVRGKHYRGPREFLRVSIDEDVARHYRTERSINEALRQLISEGRAPAPRTD
jgi:uncharacterized DUF497 family protein